MMDCTKKQLRPGKKERKLLKAKKSGKVFMLGDASQLRSPKPAIKSPSSYDESTHIGKNREVAKTFKNNRKRKRSKLHGSQVSASKILKLNLTSSRNGLADEKKIVTNRNNDKLKTVTPNRKVKPSITQNVVSLSSGADVDNSPVSKSKKKKSLHKISLKKKEQNVDRLTKSSKHRLKNCKESKAPKPVFCFESPKKFLESLLFPISMEKFFHEFWEKKPLLIHRNGKRFSDSYKCLFSRQILKEILTGNSVEFGSDVNVCRFDGETRHSLNGEGRATWKQIKNLLDKERATVQFHQPQRFLDQLWHINEKMESFFHSLVGANVYMTPQDSQGLAPHYDDVEIFILQLEGQKNWRLYKPPIELPRDYSKDLDQSTIGKPTHTILLEPGDCLYFPRGTVHQAVTPADSPSHSTHVTISTYQRSSWGDLLYLLLPGMLKTAVNSDVQFRRGLPHSYLSGDQDQFMAHQIHLKKLLQDLSNHLELHDQVAANEMMCDFIANRLPPYLKGDTAHKPKGPMPTTHSKVRLTYPEHIYVTKIQANMVGQMKNKEEDEDEELEEVDYEDDERDSDDVFTDEKEDEYDDDDDENNDDEDDDEINFGDGSYLGQISINRQGEDDDDEENEDESDEEDDEEEEDDKDEEDEEDDDDDKDDEEEAGNEEKVYIYHSIKNAWHDHMMTSESKQCSGLKVPLECLAAMKQLTEAKDKWTLVSDLKGADQIQLVVSLWIEGLLEVR